MASSTQAVVTETSVVLTGQGNWNQWIAVVCSTARGWKIREFMDPFTEKAQLPTLSAQKKPKVKDISQGAVTIAPLDGDQRELYCMLF
jgi:hypothetical protein